MKNILANFEEYTNMSYAENERFEPEELLHLRRAYIAGFSCATANLVGFLNEQDGDGICKYVDSCRLQCEAFIEKIGTDF